MMVGRGMDHLGIRRLLTRALGLIALVLATSLLAPAALAQATLRTATGASHVALPRGARPAPSAAQPRKGIVPPKNPPKNIPPNPNYLRYCKSAALDDSTTCANKALAAIDNARRSEPLGALHFNLAHFLHLTVSEQLFAIADLERTSRGLAPVQAITRQLDSVAMTGAKNNSDPMLTSGTLYGGARVFAWGSNWAGGTENALGSDDGWMYDDGPGGPNLACTSPHASGCWGHRTNILGRYGEELGSCPTAKRHVVMGAAYTTTSSPFRTSFTQIFVSACGSTPTGEVFTWAQAKKALGITG